MSIIKNRYDFVFLASVKNGNPNGDPDLGNSPRQDPETGLGIITGECIKRKIRNYIDKTKNEAPGFKIFIKEGIPLDKNRILAYRETEVEVPMKEKEKKVSTDLPKDADDSKKIMDFMVQNFYDVRAFGGVMTQKYNCGSLSGTVQIDMGESIDPISPSNLTLVNCTIVNEGEDKSKMGNKAYIPFGLYRFEGHIIANQAQKISGFTEDDLNLLWEAILNMFDQDYSAARGKMITHKLVIFKHESVLGNYPAHKLFDLVEVKKKDGIEFARSYNDYAVNINFDAIPNGVGIIEKE